MTESTSYNMTPAAHERMCAEDEEGGESCCCIQVVNLSGTEFLSVFHYLPRTLHFLNLI